MIAQRTVVVADDHPLLLKGLEDQLRSLGYKIIASVADGEQAYKAITSLKPNLAVLDIEMPGLTGLQVATKCKKEGNQACFVLLSFHQEKEIVEQAKALGVEGYLTKEDTAGELRLCLDTVLSGGNYFSSLIVEKTDGNKSEISAGLDNLSRSEYKILRLIAEGNSNADIASLLFISERTVEKHRSNIIAKLELPKQTHVLSAWASRYRDEILGFSL